MDISSAPSAPVQPIPQRTPEPVAKVEEPKVDGSADQDEALPVREVEQATETAQVSESLGSKIDVIA